jgi:tetratricopeptide (TPR) repeat protein
MDRVLNINPQNVLAYFNRASIFIELGQYKNALEDYDKAIELYPDFAKAYMNRSYVKNMLGQHKAAKKDYDTAQKKVNEYRDKNRTDKDSFADTTKKYSALLALDAFDGFLLYTSFSYHYIQNYRRTYNGGYCTKRQQPTASG